MTVATHNGFIYIACSYANYTYKILINGTDYTDKTVNAQYTKTATTSIGNFSITLSDPNAGKNISPYDIVEIYHSLDGTDVLKFKGYAEKIVNTQTTEKSHVEISGRHISSDLLNIIVNGEYSNTDATNILKDLVDRYLPDYTYNNAEQSEKTVSINFSNVSAWKAFQNLCAVAGTDVYVDENKDIHFFPEGSRLCTADALVEYDNIINMPQVAYDSTDTVTKAYVYGEDDAGLPIIESSSVSTNITKETVLIDRNINSVPSAQSIAEGVILSNVSVRDRGSIKCFLLQDLNPGDMIWVAVPTHNIHRKYIIRRFTTNVISMETTIELKDAEALPDELKKLNELKLTSTKVVNPYKLEHSFNLTFDDDSYLESTTNLYLSDGSLHLTPESYSGTAITTTIELDYNIGKFYLLVSGNNLDNSTFMVSVDGGQTYHEISNKQYLELAENKQNKYLKMKIILKKFRDEFPELKSLALLYK